MKKVIIVIAAGIVLTVSGAALAQMSENKELDEGMRGKGMMGGKMMGMMAMSQMMNRDIVATSDGGVVVLSGSTLTKYDKNLNVVKEVEVKTDDAAMPKMMKQCPMMGKGMMGGDASGGSEAAESPAETSDHESHHK